MKKSAKALLAIVAGLACAAWWVTTTPGWALVQIAHAVKSHDVELFERYVDLDQVAGHLVDAMVQSRMSDLTGGGHSGLGKLGSMLGAGVGQLLKPPLIAQFKTSALQYIASGPMDQATAAGGDQTAAGVAVLMAGVGVQTLLNPDVKVVREGNTAFVLVPFSSERLGSQQLKFTLRQQGFGWQLVEFNNAVDLVRLMQHPGASKTPSP